MVCTGCALLCNDIETEMAGEELTECRHICRQGYTLVSAAQAARQAPRFLVKGRAASLEESLLTAARLLRQAQQPLFWGLASATLEAQAKGLQLASRLGALIDDGSSKVESFVEAILKGVLPTCTLEEVRAHADTVIYWGCNPHQTHPRHLSRFTYYPQGETVQPGWEMERQLVSIDVQATEMEAVSNFFIKLAPEEERNFLASFKQMPAGQPAPDPRATELFLLLQKARYPVIFAGGNLTCALENELDFFCQMVQILERVKVIPMVTSFNQRGFYHTMFAGTGKVKRLEQSRLGSVDCCLMVGPDPLAHLTQQLAGILCQLPLIVFDPLAAAASAAAQVMIKTGLTGLTTGGSAIRQDGVEVRIDPVFPEPAFSDARIFEMLLAAV